MDQIIMNRIDRAKNVRQYGSIAAALKASATPSRADISLSEALVLGLGNLGVKTFVGIFGHGSTDIGEVLRVYSEAGALRVFNVRHETLASHAASALRWVRNERAAVFTSIGPGALQAFAGSLVQASNGLGVWHIYGDETTHDEGPNMQQIPKHEQGLFARLFGTLGNAYSVHSPLSISEALRRGSAVVDHPWRPGPFFLLMPMNTQPVLLRDFNLAELPGSPPAFVAPVPPDTAPYSEALDAIVQAKRVVVKAGGGARCAAQGIKRFVEAAGAVLVHTPIATGVLNYNHPQNMTVGGSKGSVCGNYAMEEADLVVTVGTRFVCQSDSSRTGYPKATRVININPEPMDAFHYQHTVSLLGDADVILNRLADGLQQFKPSIDAHHAQWLDACALKKAEWTEFKNRRYAVEGLFDPLWNRQVLTQPVVIKDALAWARANGRPAFFDAGDVQANGFQIAEDSEVGQTFTETGASYMGFAVSALLAGGMAQQPFTGLALSGDGSFMMNPQILIDAVHANVSGTILLLDNRRMAAISGLQKAQYGAEFATWDHVAVDYVAMARSVAGVNAIGPVWSRAQLASALDEASKSHGLFFIHVPVYCGDDPLGGLGAYGRWNVGCWVEETQRLRHEIGL